MQIIPDLSFLNNNLIEKMKFSDNQYIQMANLSSGGSDVDSHIITNTNQNLSSSANSRSSFRYPSINQELPKTTTSSVKSVFKFPMPVQSQINTQNNDTVKSIEFIDDVTNAIEDTTDVSEQKKLHSTDTMNTDDQNGLAVYNFPWDYKLKLQMQAANFSLSPATAITSTTSTSSTPATTPQFPTSAVNSNTTLTNNPGTDSDESQYCSPWDLKLQEEMFKIMSQQQSKTVTNATSSNSNIITVGSSNSHSNSMKAVDSETSKLSIAFKRSNEFNSSIKSNKSVKDINLCPNSTIESSSLLENIEQNDYSPPWETKQSILLQSLTSASNNTSNNITKSISPPHMIQPLATSSAISTLTNSANIINNQQNQAITSLFNQFSRTRLSTRSNTSSSSSSHSSTSSLSTNSPPSIPPPPLPPSIPPPPPPQQPKASSSSLNTNINTNNNFNWSVHHTNQQLSCHQSPRMLHRNVCQQANSNPNILLTRVNSGNGNSLLLNNATGTTASFAIVPMMTANSSQCSNLIQCPISNNLTSLNSNNSSYLNETNNFCTWNTTNCTHDTLASNFDENSKQMFIKPQQQQMNSSSSCVASTQNGFVFPHQHFQTVSSNQLLSGDIQVALPVTALVFSQSSSLPSNLLAQQQNLLSTSNTITNNNNGSFLDSNTMSNLQSLERQIWFHGRITRKQAEIILVNRPIGSFLVRQSESGNSNDFSLSLVGSGCVHMRICMKNGEFILGQCSQPFNSIVKMIEHYGKVEVPIKGAQHVKLIHPVPV